MTYRNSNRYSGYTGPDLERMRSVMRQAYAAGKQYGLSESEAVLDAAQQALAREHDAMARKIDAMHKELEARYTALIEQMQNELRRDSITIKRLQTEVEVARLELAAERMSNSRRDPLA